MISVISVRFKDLIQQYLLISMQNIELWIPQTKKTRPSQVELLICLAKITCLPLGVSSL